ncbi:MAG: hypothetical protein J0I84_11265 [Terrimonas sp.]|nr:hypothetical protein [Terrimonas sp.]OJY91688.1 MAG: hypothetical protein BGP13_07820 [Sphingobacteriales bacterium 40-81]
MKIAENKSTQLRPQEKRKWLKIIEDNFSELHIGDKVAPAYPGNISNEVTDEPVEENSNRINEVYSISGIDVSNGAHIVLTNKNNSTLNVSRKELLDSWWLQKNNP